MFRSLFSFLKNNWVIKRFFHLTVVGVSFVAGITITKSIVIAIDNKQATEEDHHLIKIKSKNLPEIIPGTFLVDLSKRFSYLLNVNSLDDNYWYSSLKANKKELTEHNLILLKNKCKQIYETPIELLDKDSNLKSEYENFVRFNCRKPRKSKDKFRDNNVRYFLVERTIWTSKNLQIDPRFWTRVELFNKDNKLQDKSEKLKNYCMKFPSENPTSYRQEYSQEEKDYIKYCL